MKVMIVFFICIAAVFGQLTSGIKELDDSIKDASNACIRELKRDERFISDEGPPSDPCLLEDPNFITCLDKKMGVMNEDGTYNLQRILSYVDSDKSKQEVESEIKNKTSACAPKAGNDACKMTACVRKLSESWCGRAPNKDDGC